MKDKLKKSKKKRSTKFDVYFLQRKTKRIAWNKKTY